MTLPRGQIQTQVQEVSVSIRPKRVLRRGKQIRLGRLELQHRE
jgi:hypothetical protein